MNATLRRSIVGWCAWGVLPLGVLAATGCADVGSRDVTESSEQAAEGLAGAGGAAGAPGTGGLGGDVGGSAGAGGGVGGGGFALETAFYAFDDCSASDTTLLDSSPTGAHATRSAGVTCGTGLEGLAVEFDGRQDIVRAPSVPELTFSTNLAVAAWVRPRSTRGTRVIAHQSDSRNRSAFHLAIKDGRAEFSVGLEGGGTVTSSAPIASREWTHVAGLFDGQFVFLFVNGQRVGQIAAAGTLRGVSGAVQIGSNLRQQHFDGAIDNVWISSNPVSEFDIAGLACLRRDPLVEVSPTTSGPVAPDTTVPYEVRVTNRDVGACGAADLALFTQTPPGFEVVPSADSRFLEPGETTSFEVAVTGTADAEPGVHEIPFELFDFSQFRIVPGSLVYELTEPQGCFVRTAQELLIRDVSVVDDPVRTSFDGDPADARAGVWTFARLMENMAPTAEQAPAMVRAMFDTWLTDQVVNGFSIPARPELQSLVLDPWPKLADGRLDLTRAPLRLLAIVNRIDVRLLDQGHAGEGRFVFGVLSPRGTEEFTIILEYRLPATTEADVLDWAARWHALGSLPFPSEEYNAALQQITEGFAGRNAEPGRPNGSALAQLRTNEIALAPVWELREFALSAEGALVPATVKLTPDESFNRTSALADFINQNEASILVERHDVPEQFQGGAFVGGSILNELTGWFAPGINNNEARHKFSLNTCNGCHGLDETGTSFLHVFPRQAGSPSALSGFMTGISVADPVTGEPRLLNDLRRRRADLESLVCPPVPAGSGARAASSDSTSSTSGARTTVARGIGRVH